MQQYAEILQKISNKIGCIFSPASGECLQALREINVPEVIIEFYINYEPPEECEINDISIFDVPGVYVANTEYNPGFAASKYGYFAFASNLYGDAYCFDTNISDRDGNPRIIFMSHEIVYDDSSEEEVHMNAYYVTDNLLNFLNMLYDEEIKEDYADYGDENEAEKI